jgi:anaerobic selenocysteine-containing dehydrogenase
MDILKTKLSRRRFLQASGVAAGATAVAGGAGYATLAPLSEAQAQEKAAGGGTKITKSVCHQCPARCGIDVYTTDGRVHAIFGNPEHPIANGKLCPKGHLGTYILYDPDRFKGPMKRTNPKKGRNEDPKFVPISWDEALDTIAGRLQALRDKGASLRAALRARLGRFLRRPAGHLRQALWLAQRRHRPCLAVLRGQQARQTGNGRQ